MRIGWFAAFFHKMDTSSGLSSIASLSLGFTMSMRAGGMARSCPWAAGAVGAWPVKPLGSPASAGPPTTASVDHVTVSPAVVPGNSDPPRPASAVTVESCRSLIVPCVSLVSAPLASNDRHKDAVYPQPLTLTLKPDPPTPPRRRGSNAVTSPTEFYTRTVITPDLSTFFLILFSSTVCLRHHFAWTLQTSDIFFFFFFSPISLFLSVANIKLERGKGAYTCYRSSSYDQSPPQKRSGMARVLKGFHSFTCTPTFIRNRNEPYLPLPSQPQLVLIYRPRRDGRLSRPSCEVAQAEIRTCNLPIANPALYHTATSAHLEGFELVTERSRHRFDYWSITTQSKLLTLRCPCDRAV